MTSSILPTELPANRMRVRTCVRTGWKNSIPPLFSDNREWAWEMAIALGDHTVYLMPEHHRFQSLPSGFPPKKNESFFKFETVDPLDRSMWHKPTYMAYVRIFNAFLRDGTFTYIGYAE